MALIAYPTQASYATLPPRPLSCIKEVKLKSFIAPRLVGVSNRSILLNHRFLLSVREPLICKSKVKHPKILAFKGTAQDNGSSGGSSGGSKISQNSVKLSYAPHEDEETITESPDVQEAPLSYSSEEEAASGSQAIHTTQGSPAIRKLFRKWLMMLRTQSSDQASSGIFEERSPQCETSGREDGDQKQENLKILKAVWCFFVGVDATIKVPVLIFVPWYLVVSLVYGAEVSKELTPLWTIGPLIVALYIKMLQGLCALYAFTFKQTLKIVKNLPAYYQVTYSYVAEGKLKSELYARFWQPVVDIKNLDYKELSKRKLKELEVWAVEKYLDYVESIWPYYCRTIRFLKKANLI
ncbi:hypothetical protein Scep_017860 [Stephania cephalantha]|uniref:Embryo defective 2759 n=1 Tax=Stephania cephalantha TaxID=152367 RepID=A0AAP0NU10_9MAGN